MRAPHRQPHSALQQRLEQRNSEPAALCLPRCSSGSSGRSQPRQPTAAELKSCIASVYPRCRRCQHCRPPHLCRGKVPLERVGHHRRCVLARNVPQVLSVQGLPAWHSMHSAFNAMPQHPGASRGHWCMMLCSPGACLPASSCLPSSTHPHQPALQLPSSAPSTTTPICPLPCCSALPIPQLDQAADVSKTEAGQEPRLLLWTPTCRRPGRLASRRCRCWGGATVGCTLVCV